MINFDLNWSFYISRKKTNHFYKYYLTYKWIIIMSSYTFCSTFFGEFIWSYIYSGYIYSGYIYSDYIYSGYIYSGGQTAYLFLVACTWLYNPQCQLVGRSVGNTAFSAFFWCFWAAAPKGTKSCRTQGDFRSFVRSFVRLFIHSSVCSSPPGPHRPEICPLRPEI